MPSPSEHTQHSTGSAVSLRDVAAAVGVSRMTASRAFKPQAPVNPQLRAKILEAAKRMGYVPDAMVSELMTSFANRRPVQYHETFAALWWPARWSNLNTASDFDAEIYRGLNEGARLHGRRMDHLVLGDDLKPRALERMLRTRGIQGVILTPPLPAHTPPPALDWQRFSAAVVGSSLEAPGLNRAQANHHQGVVLALRQLHDLGYRRPCLLVRNDLEERMQRVYSGAFLAWGNPQEHVWRQSVPDIAGLNEWLRKVEPDVIIGDCDKWLGDLSPQAAARGFVSLDVRNPQGEIAGVYQNSARIAMAAIDLLVRARLMHETGILDAPLVMLTSGIWCDAPSLKRGRHARAKRSVSATPAGISSAALLVADEAETRQADAKAPRAGTTTVAGKANAARTQTKSKAARVQAPEAKAKSGSKARASRKSEGSN